MEFVRLQNAGNHDSYLIKIGSSSPNMIFPFKKNYWLNEADILIHFIGLIEVCLLCTVTAEQTHCLLFWRDLT